jgi:hypothetical protein
MNLNRINDYPGTGTNANTPAWSSTPFKNYAIHITKILVSFLIFGWMTATNYCNTLEMDDVDKYYPIDDAILNKLSAQNKNPYGSNLVSCEYINDVSKDRDKLESISRWFQTTQESSYETGGKILNKFFKFSKYLMSNHTLNVQASTSFISFVIWVIFGLFTHFSFSLMMVLLLGMWIPGWIGGLLAFMPITYTTQSRFLRIAYKITVFIMSFILMCVASIVTVFPVIYEFAYLFYLFFFKQLFSADPSKVSAEFMRRMKHLIIVYVIVALIIATVQLPPEAAGAMAVAVLLSGGIIHYFSKKTAP